MHKIQIGNKITRDYPESISEMSTAQFIAFSELVFQYQSNQITYREFKIRLAYKLLNMERVVNIKTSINADKITENINLIAQLNDGFFDDKITNGKNYKVIKLDFVKTLVPKIKVGKAFYYGPDDGLTNTEFGEYVSALNSYIDYSSSGNVEDLDRMIASLYRPASRNTKLEDKRVEYNKDLVSWYAKQVHKIPFSIKYAIYLYFSACQHFIVTTKNLPISGGVEIDLSVLFKPGTTTEKSIGMVGVIYTLAETNVFGDAEKTEKQNTYAILLRMVQTYYQAQKQKRDAKNN